MTTITKTVTGAQIKAAVLDYLDTAKAATWDNPNHSDAYKEQRRKAILGPQQAELAALTDRARQQRRDAQEALSASLEMLTDGTNPNRVVARELAWARMRETVEARGAGNLTSLVTDATAIELEALHLGAGMLAANPSRARDAARLREEVAAAYPTAHGVPERVQKANADVVATAPAEAWADLSDALLKGHGFAEVGGAVWSRLLTLSGDDDGRVVYDMMRDGIPVPAATS